MLSRRAPRLARRRRRRAEQPPARRAAPPARAGAAAPPPFRATRRAVSPGSAVVVDDLGDRAAAPRPAAARAAWLCQAALAAKANAGRGLTPLGGAPASFRPGTSTQRRRSSTPRRRQVRARAAGAPPPLRAQRSRAGSSVVAPPASRRRVGGFWSMSAASRLQLRARPARARARAAPHRRCRAADARGGAEACSARGTRLARLDEVLRQGASVRCLSPDGCSGGAKARTASSAAPCRPPAAELRSRRRALVPAIERHPSRVYSEGLSVSVTASCFRVIAAGENPS